MADVTSVDLSWKDNSNNETEFRLEMKALNGAFRDVGGFSASPAAVQNLELNTIYTFRIRARNAAGDSAYSNEVTVSTNSGPQACISLPDALCVQQDRFIVKAFWKVGQGPYVPASAVPMTSDTGYFWFFSPNNVELVVKVLNGESVNGYFWVYAGGLTDVGVLLTVTDSLTGKVKTYVNPAGTRFLPIQDTKAACVQQFTPCR